MKRITTLEERREFLTRALALVGGCVCTGMLAACETDVLKSSNVAVRFDVTAEPELAQIGGAVKKIIEGQNGGAPILIIRLEDEEFLVLSTICTHEACEVNLPGEYHPEIQCDCHGSVFSRTTGDLLEGPATAPLQRFENTFDDGTGTLTIQF